MVAKKSPKRAKKGQGARAKKRLSPLQLLAIDQLAAGAKQVVVVERAGCSSSSLKRWLKDPLFCSKLEERIQESREDSLRYLKTLAQKAVETLEQIMENTEAPAAARASIAFKILEVSAPVLGAKADPEITEEKIAHIRQTIYGVFE